MTDVRRRQMNKLPYVTQGYDVPAEQPVTPGTSHDYVGIYVLDNDPPRIVVPLKTEFLKFGKTEGWSPAFECNLPLEIEPRKENEDRYFQIWFTGIPGRKEDFIQTVTTCRHVVITAIKRMFEGSLPPMVR